jgi:flagellar assembly protein FliH
MSAVRFRFEQSFDNGASDLAAQESARHQAELEAVRQEAYAQGHADGNGAALASLDAAMSDMLGRLSVDMQTLFDHLDDVRRSVIADAAVIAASAGSALGARLAHSAPVERIVEAFEAALGDHLDSPRIVLRVHALLLDETRRRVEQSAQMNGFGGRLILLADAGLGETDVTIEWAHGGLTLDLGEQRRRLEQAAQDFALGILNGSDLPQAPEQMA